MNATYHYVRPFPLIIQVVAATFTAVAMPLAARVFGVVVVPVLAKIKVSAQPIESDTLAAVINVIVVPIWKATLAFVGIVTV